MSDYYRAKVTNVGPIDVLAALSPELFLHSRATRGAPQKARRQAFERALRSCEAARARGVLQEWVGPLRVILDDGIVAGLSKEPKAAVENGPVDAARTWYWQGFLADRFPKAFSRIPANLVSLEVAQHHPDAPPVDGKGRGGPFIGRAALEAFALRLLTEADARGWLKSPIYGLFPNDGWAQKNFGGNWTVVSDVVWGVRVVDRLAVKATSKAFWTKHANAWWADDEQFTALVKDRPSAAPLYVARYEIAVHPFWISRTARGPFDSRAFG
jgi:hypothetical protein